MDNYLLLKYLHILFATVLLGTGAGIAFFMLMAAFSKNVSVILHTARFVILADWLFTAPAVVGQFTTGTLLIQKASHLIYKEKIMYNSALLIAAILNALAALLHLGCIYFGAPWYRFFGAGEEIARMAEAGSWVPAVITTAIASVLGIWCLYALSGAGIVRKLPLARTALCIITAIYLLRGFAVLPVAALLPQEATAFLWWSSAICVGFGLVHLVGLTQRWNSLAHESHYVMD